jgi:sulfite reductase alpha subunit-like flavoprotein
MIRAITILYGSQTGSAQDVAEQIARDGKRRRFAIKLSPMDDYDMVMDL